MEGSSDVMATWAWGLRRYWWVVVLFVVGLGVLVPLAQSRSADVYEAQSQVGPSKQLLLPNLDPLPRFAQSVFDNGAVASDVRALRGLPPGASVIPGTVQLRTAQDNPVMIITGQGSSPAIAASVANAAAATFVVQLNRYSGSVGTFAVQSDAVPPAKPEPKIISGPWGLVVGLLAGLVAGCGAVGLVVALRHPVVGAGAAAGTTGLPVLGRVPLLRRGPPDGTERMAIGAVSRRLLKGEHDVVYVTGPVQGQVDRVASGVSTFLGSSQNSGSSLAYGDLGPRDPTSPRSRSAPEIAALDSSSLETWVEAPGHCSLTLLVVPEGIRAGSLRQLVDQRTAGSAAALVLVARRGLWTSLRRTRKAAAANSHAG
jgi:hypothetical protein